MPSSSCFAAFSCEWVIWVFPAAHNSSSLFQDPANSVCMTAFPVCTYCWAFIKAVTGFASCLLQHHFLGFGNYNLACFVSFQKTASEGFCSLTFDRKSTYIWLLHLCRLRHKLHVLDMNICNANSFSSSETLSKMLVLSCPQKLDHDWPTDMWKLLLTASCCYPACPSVFIYCTFCILNSLYLTCHLFEAGICLFSFVWLSGASWGTKSGRL